MLLIRNPDQTQQVQDWFVLRLTTRPHALFQAAELAMEHQDYPAAATAARNFIDSIPLPMPVDAFGENYRTALHILRECAKQSSDLSGRLKAGRLARLFDPRDTVAMVDYAEALDEAGQRTDATEVYQAAFAIRPFSARISNALSSLYSAAGESQKAAAVQERHLEAVALCLNENAWLSGNLVYYGAGQSIAQDIQLTYPQTTEISVVFKQSTDGAYLVLKGLPHLRYTFERAELITPAQQIFRVVIDPQQNLLRVDERTAQSDPAPDLSLVSPATVNLDLGAQRVAGTTLVLRIRIEPEAKLEPWVRQFGTWEHPRIPVTQESAK